MIDILRENVEITELSNFKTEAKAKYYFEINSEDDLDNLSKVFEYIKENNLKHLFI